MPNPPRGNIPAPGPGILGGIPVIGPVYDAAGNLIGHFGAGGKLVKAAEGAAGSVGKTAFQDVLKNFPFENWILRIGEILLGIVLIGVGVAKLTGTDNFVMKAATTAGKAALL